MKFVAIAGIVGVAVAAGTWIKPEALWQLYQDVYPADPAERHALDDCFANDPRFNRLDAEARQACYRHNLPAFARTEMAALPRPSANFVDLWRAAGEGRMPQNDIRYEEQNDRFTHPAPLARH